MKDIIVNIMRGITAGVITIIITSIIIIIIILATIVIIIVTFPFITKAVLCTPPFLSPFSSLRVQNKVEEKYFI